MGKRKHEEAGGGEAAAQPRGQHSRLDKETLSYYAEIDAHFKTLSDEEERQLAADAALAEAAERGPEVAADAACSRVLEALLPAASGSAVAAFTRACVEGEGLGLLCTSGPFGSHVLEKCLTQLARRAASAPPEEYEAVEQALAAVSEAAAECLYEMATSKYGSFVARRLLCVLSGRDVAPPPGRKGGAAAGAPGGEGQAAGEAAQQLGQQGQQGPRGGGALAAKLGADPSAAGGGDSASADYPELLDKVAAAALSDDWGGEEMVRLAADPFAGPVLQALLRACTHNPKLLQRLLLHVLGSSPSKGMEGVALERCHALLQDRNGSHLMEAVFQTAPDDFFAKLTTLCFKGHLLPLAQHPAANFAVQAALAALRKPQQLKRMFEDLRPAFAQLLRSRRGGVIAALLAAAGRLGAQEAEAAAALWAAAGEGAESGPLAALLTLDTHTQLGGGGRLSTLGCAMAVALLRLPPAACKQWAEAVAALPPGQLRHVAKDPGGCRVLEAYLEGPGAAAKKRRSLLQALRGCYGEVAAGGSGSHFVEKCYALGEVAEKEAIAAELAAAEARLMATHRGPVLLRRCHVDAYKKGGEGWQQRAAAADAARREFEDLFGAAAEAGAHGDAEGGEDPEERAAAREAAAEQQAEAAEGGQQQEKTRKKKQKKEAAAAEAEQEVKHSTSMEGSKKAKKKAAAAAGQQDANGKKIKKQKTRNASVQPQAAGAPVAQPAHKKKKKNKE